MKYIYILTAFMLLNSCIEPFDFVIEDTNSMLVVEGYISDRSYEETLAYPSNGRFFNVKLSYTSDVTNRRGAKVTAAKVQLISDSKEAWDYVEQSEGVYVLMDKSFKATTGKSYQLKILLDDDSKFESDWVKLPLSNPAMGDIDFEETTKQKYIVVASEKKLTSVNGVKLNVSLPENSADSPNYYRWDFEASWLYTAPLYPYVNKTCYITTNTYLTDYKLQEDRVGGYDQELFFIETNGNERVYDQFSALVRQYQIRESDYYYFNELQEQASGGNLLDKPPYNLKSNIVSLSEETDAVGYFWIGREQAKRWYFNIYDLSYPVKDNILEECMKPYGPPGRGEIDPCRDCLGYSDGKASTTKPHWWN